MLTSFQPIAVVGPVPPTQAQIALLAQHGLTAQYEGGVYPFDLKAVRALLSDLYKEGVRDVCCVHPVVALEATDNKMAVWIVETTIRDDGPVPGRLYRCATDEGRSKRPEIM